MRQTRFICCEISDFSQDGELKDSVKDTQFLFPELNMVPSTQDLA